MSITTTPAFKDYGKLFVEFVFHVKLHDAAHVAQVSHKSIMRDSAMPDVLASDDVFAKIKR